MLEDGERTPLGLVAVTPESKIMCRMIDRDVSADISQAWFAEKFKAALAHRERLYADPYYRLIHAEADGLPGVDSVCGAAMGRSAVVASGVRTNTHANPHKHSSAHSRSACVSTRTT